MSSAKKRNRLYNPDVTSGGFKLNYSTSSFRYPCLVTTYSLSMSLPWNHIRDASGIPISLELTGGEYKT